MSYQITVTIPDRPPLKFVLRDDRFLLGSHRDCPLRVDFDEIAGRAAQIDVRGEAVFLRNLNAFPIYVGEYELNANEQTEWPVGQMVLLSASVSLALHDLTQYGAQNDAEIAAKKARSTVQIAVLLVCITLGWFLLSNEGSTSRPSTAELNYDFTELVEHWGAIAAESDGQKRRYRTVLNYLIDARVCDVRWGIDDPGRAISAYELLLDSRLIEGSVHKPDSPEDRIRAYALARVNDLSAELTAEN